MRNDICEECGLPSTVCSALSFFRLAADCLEHGEFEAAWRNVKVAKEYFEEFSRDRRS
jgi:hypothetical protein